MNIKHLARCSQLFLLPRIVGSKSAYYYNQVWPVHHYGAAILSITNTTLLVLPCIAGVFSLAYLPINFCRYALADT